MAMIAFYGEQPIDVQKSIIKNIIPQPIVPFLSNIKWTEEKLGKIRKSYIECSLDEALPIAHQKAYQKYMKFKVIKTLESDHSPFFLMPTILANTIMDVLKQ